MGWLTSCYGPHRPLSNAPSYPATLGKAIRLNQKDGRLQDASALMVWLFTPWAGGRLELRQLGRDMWRELSRGFPYVYEAVSGFKMLSGAGKAFRAPMSFLRA